MRPARPDSGTQYSPAGGDQISFEAGTEIAYVAGRLQEMDYYMAAMDQLYAYNTYIVTESK